MSIKIAYETSNTPVAKKILKKLSDRFKSTMPHEKADVIVAIGGDGFMLQMLHKYLNTDKDVYGVNCGTVGFLLNTIDQENLAKRITLAKKHILHPLHMTAIDYRENVHTALGFNEISLFRTTGQALHLQISIMDRVRLTRLVCDGILVATPAGSTAYNFSVHGPILPIDANILALSPISPFRPRRWRGALLPNTTKVAVDIIEPQKRPAAVVADNREFRDIKRLTIVTSLKDRARVLTDSDHDLEERIIREQFF